MVDRGITEVHANETIYKTGMFLQMFPYPCYIYDRFVTICVFLSGPKIYFVTNVNETNKKFILFERRFDFIFTSFSSSFKFRYY